MIQTAAHEPVPAIEPAIKFATREFTKHFILIFGALLIYSTGGTFVGAFMPNPHLSNIAVIIWDSFLIGGLMSMLLALIDGQEPPFSMLFSKLKDFWKYLAASLVFTTLVGVGLLLLLVPGIFVGVRLSQFQFAIAEKNSRPIDALRYSWQITQGSFWRIVLFYLTLGAIVLIPMIVVGAISWFASIPIKEALHMKDMVAWSIPLSFGTSIVWTFIYPASVHAYKQLCLKTQNVGPI